MFAIKRNQVIVSSLVVMIVVAGYLNYVDSTRPSSTKLTYNGSDAVSTDAVGNSTSKGTTVVDDATGQAVMVVNASSDGSATANKALALTNVDGTNSSSANAQTDPSAKPAPSPTAAAKSSSKSQADSGSAVFVNSSSDSSFFVQAKLDREQSRAKEKDTLLSLINNANIEKDQKAVCANNMLTIEQRVEKESSTEALIEAKGFTQAYVRINDDGVEVVVSKSVLSDAEIAQISDIVTRKTGFDIAKIKVSPLKAN